MKLILTLTTFCLFCNCFTPSNSLGKIDGPTEQLTFGLNNKFWPVLKRLETRDPRLTYQLEEKIFHPKRDKRQTPEFVSQPQMESREFQGLKRLLNKEWKKLEKKKNYILENQERQSYPVQFAPSVPPLEKPLKQSQPPIRIKYDTLKTPVPLPVDVEGPAETSTPAGDLNGPNQPVKKGLIGFLLEAVVKTIEEQQQETAKGSADSGNNGRLTPDSRSRRGRVLRRQKRFFLPSTFELPSLFIDLLSLFRKA